MPYDFIKKPTTPNSGYGGQLNINGGGFAGFGNQSFNVRNMGQEYSDLQGQIGDRYKDITDFQSPFYQQYRKFLQSTMGGIGQNALLGGLMAGNVDYGTAQKLGAQRGQEMQGQRTEAVNQGVQGFALQAQSMANPLLGMQSNNYFNQQSAGLDRDKLTMMQEQAAYDRKWSPISSLLNLFGAFGGMAAGQLMAGGGGGQAKSPYGDTYGDTNVQQWR